MRTFSFTFLLLGVFLPLYGFENDKGSRSPRPRQVTLQASATALGKVLESIEKETKIRVEASPEIADYPVSISLEKANFWPALDAVAKAAGARVDLYGRSGKLRLVKRGTAPLLPVSYDGLFRSSIKKIIASRDFETGAQGLIAQVEIAWEPHLEPLLLETQPQQMVLKNEEGKPVPVPLLGSTLAPVDGRTWFTLDVPLPALPRSATRIGLLEGQLTAVAPSRMLTLEFGSLAQVDKAAPGGAERRRGDRDTGCTITNVKLDSSPCTVRVALELPPGGPVLESYQSWIVNNEMYVVNKAGKERRASSYVVQSSPPRRASISYHFTDAEVLARPEEWKVVYRMPASLVELPLKFTFKEILLP